MALQTHRSWLRLLFARYSVKMLSVLSFGQSRTGHALGATDHIDRDQYIGGLYWLAADLSFAPT